MGAMNELIDRAVVARLSSILEAAGGGIRFAKTLEAADAVDGLNLRARADLVGEAIVADLPQEYSAGARVIRAALDDPGFSGWMLWPVTEAVTTIALASDGGAVSDDGAFEDGLELLAELTPRLTAEFAIRRFLDADLDRSLAVITAWTANPDEHVRRLASEGTRPFLPWATRVRSILDRPEATLPILTALRADESLYVRRSVANHLNDLNREHPELLVATAAEWMGTADENTHWVVRHGIRTLIKRAHPGALALMGFETVSVSVAELELDRAVVSTPGELGFVVDIVNDSDAPARLVIDYVVHYVKANGATNEKVFKLAVKTLEPRERVRLQKRHAFRQMTTRVHYAGVHALEVQVNGERHARAEFALEV